MQADVAHGAAVDLQTRYTPLPGVAAAAKYEVPDTGGRAVSYDTPDGPVTLPVPLAASASDPRLLDAERGLAVFRGPGERPGYECIYVQPVATRAGGIVGCDRAAVLDEQGAVASLLSGDGSLYHVAVVGRGADAAPRANGIGVPTRNGVGIVSAEASGDVEFSAGSWAKTSVGTGAARTARAVNLAPASPGGP